MLRVSVLLVLLAINLASVASGGDALAEKRRLKDWFLGARKRVPYAAAPGIAAVVFPGNDAEPFILGSGAQRLGRPEAVDENTLFEIGSLSKTFLTVAIGTLVAEGKMSFDDPVRKFMGRSFNFGPHSYVSETLTIRDLLAHRSGLAEGQGGFLGALMPSALQVQRLSKAVPVHSLRQVFDYSNTGFVLAGEILRSAAGAQSWCDALHERVFIPLNLNSTFCHRNELPDEIASQHLASVHKMDPCSGEGDGDVPRLTTYDFVTTGGPRDFAWGAADAAGSIISSAADMQVFLSLILGKTTFLPSNVLNDIASGQMVTGAEWAQACGISIADGRGQGLTAGLGLDVASDISIHSTTVPYVEKNGDTNMHKARLGLFPRAQSGVLLLSNLGGAMGGQLTAMKFGMLTLLASGTAADADKAAASSLNTTGFWKNQWIPGTTCTKCGSAAISRRCNPSGFSSPPFSPGAVQGIFKNVLFGSDAALSLRYDQGRLMIDFGPCQECVLEFSPSSFALKDELCASVIKSIPMASWNSTIAISKKFASLSGHCSMAQYILPPEIPLAGVSANQSKVAFPWGCGYIPLPDGASVYIAKASSGEVIVSLMGEVFSNM